MKDKNSFILYTNIYETVKQLPKEKAGELFVTILEYVNDLNPEPDDLLVKIAFEPIKQALKADLKKWISYQEKQADNGKKGGRPKKEETEPLKEETQKTQAFSEKPKKTEYVFVFDSVIESEYEILWTLYEKKGSKKKAKEIFAKLKPEERNGLAKAIEIYKSNREYRFRKDFERFLKDRTFESNDCTVKIPVKPVQPVRKEVKMREFSDYFKNEAEHG